MGDEESTIVAHTRLPLKVQEQLKALVEEGYYSNISDALRQGARVLINSHEGALQAKKPKGTLELKQFKV